MPKGSQVDYLLIEADNAKELTEEVALAIGNGFTVLGNPSVAVWIEHYKIGWDKTRYWYVQGMVRQTQTDL